MLQYWLPSNVAEEMDIITWCMLKFIPSKTRVVFLMSFCLFVCSCLSWWRGLSSVFSCVFLTDPCSQLLSFHTFKQILRCYQVAWSRHGFTVGRQCKEIVTRAGFPGWLLQHSLTWPLPHWWASVLSMTVKHVSSDANSPTFGFGCGVQMKSLKKDWRQGQLVLHVKRT